MTLAEDGRRGRKRMWSDGQWSISAQRLMSSGLRSRNGTMCHVGTMGRQSGHSAAPLGRESQRETRHHQVVLSHNTPNSLSLCMCVCLCVCLVSLLDLSMCVSASVTAKNTTGSLVGHCSNVSYALFGQKYLD